jgi:gamma-glutamyltranspeptidase/glutathione hydrolase
MIDRQRASARPLPAASGDTTSLCTMEAGGLAVSLIQSNASGFGSGLVEPNTQINLHNRGIGFTLQAGHPAELGPRRRPPHTLSPALIRHDGDIRAVVATMGGDAQPQIMTQLIARLVHHNQRPSKANDAARFALAGPDHGFDTWTTATPTVQLEAHAPPSWATELARHGHRVAIKPRFDSAFGHANLIEQRSDGLLAGSADRRSVVGAAAGI